MRYHRKSYYRRPLYKQAQRNENFFNVYEYLRLEFLNADTEIFNHISNFYKNQYGSSAFYYMLNTYNSWKSGTVKISTLTMDRILECVPKFLSKEKRLFILKCEIHNFIEKAKGSFKNKDLNLNDWFTIYKSLQNEIINFNQSNLHWFIGKNIFPQEQIECYLSICKYALNERLLQSYRQVKEDLNVIREKFFLFTYSLDSASYKINFLNLNINLRDIEKNLIKYIPLYSLEVRIEESFKKFGETYLLDELMKMNFYENEGKVNLRIKSREIDIFFSHFKQLTKASNEITMSSIFQGEGGQLSMELEFMPLKKSIESILISTLKIILIVVGIAVGAFLVIKFKIYWIIYILLLGGIIFVIYIIGLIPIEINKIYKAIIQIKRYGNQ